MLPAKSARSRPLFLSFLFFVSLVPYQALAQSTADILKEDWGRILKNNDGKEPCDLQAWMASDACKDDDEQRRALVYSRDASNFQPSSCTCTPIFFNVWCGCELSEGNPAPNSTRYVSWQDQCSHAGFDLSSNVAWMNRLSEDIPVWAFTMVNNGSFNVELARRAALAPNTWTLIQIITPIVVGVALLLFVTLGFIYWRRYERYQKTRNYPNFTDTVRTLFSSRTRNVRHEGRDEDWKIDNDENPDNESFFMVPRAASIVDSPIEVSHWSPSTMSFASTPQPHRNRFTFTPRRPSSLSVEQRVPGKATLRTIGDRVRDIMPWKRRPSPVVNHAPPPRYDIDRNTIGSRSRQSTLSTRMGTFPGRGRYSTITEEEDEDLQTSQGASGSGSGSGRRTQGNGPVTEADKRAIANSVLLIGDNFTLESGSTSHGTPIRPTAVAARTANVRTDSGDTRRGDTSTLSMSNFQVVPPSPTLDLHQPLPTTQSPVQSLGPPPLLPPPPVGPAPEPPIARRPTPRRTPSPQLRVKAQPDDAARGHSRTQSAPNAAPSATAGSSSSTPYMHPALRPSPPESTQPSLKNQPVHPHPYPGDHSNSLSYASLHHPSASQTSLNNNNNNNNNHHHQRAGSETSAGRAPPELNHQSSNTSMGQFSILRTPKGSDSSGRALSSISASEEAFHGHPPPQPEFDPYAGIPRPLANEAPIRLQPNRHPQAHNGAYHPLPHPPPQYQHIRSASSTSLPRAPGDSVGQHQRGWSADDETSSLIGRAPMQVDGASVRGVYLATPREVEVRDGRHVRNVSSESFATVVSDYGGGAGSAFGVPVGQERLSPALSDDDIVRANFAGRQSVSGSSGWDASTQTHGDEDEPSPQPFPPNARPLTQRTREITRSREDVLVPTRNDPVMLFPGVVRAQGYVSRLPPDAIPVPLGSPRANAFANTHRRANGSGGGSGGGSRSASGSGGENEGPGPGADRYVDSSRGGSGWGTQSSGAQSLLQQLPELYKPPSPPERTAR